MIQAHFDAVWALLDATAPLQGRGSDTLRVDASGAMIRDTYWILYGGGPDDLVSGRFALPQQQDSDAVFVYTVRSVSTTAAGARATFAKTYERTVGVKPTVAGRQCDPLELSLSTDVEADRSINPPLFFADLEITLRTVKA